MGQMVSVVEKRSSTPGIVRFEANRVLTGQGHERFASAADAVGPRPAAELGRRLFASGQVDGVHVYGNVVTVHLRRGFQGEGLYDIVRELYQYWKPGMEPQVFVEEAPAAAAPTEKALWDFLGVPPAAEVAVAPVAVRNRAVNLIYAHPRGERFEGSYVDELNELAVRASEAYVRLIRQAKG